MDLYAELMALTAALDAAGLEYALAGGLALAVHGAPRATSDIDLLVQRDQVERIVLAVRELGFKFQAIPMRFPDGMTLRRVTKIVDGEALTLDLMLVNDPLASAWASRARYDGDQGALVVVSREALIAMKTWAGRPQDLADIARLQGDDR